MRWTANHCRSARRGRRGSRRSEGGRPRTSGRSCSFLRGFAILTSPPVPGRRRLVTVCPVVSVSKYGCRPKCKTRLQITAKSGIDLATRIVLLELSPTPLFCFVDDDNVGDTGTATHACSPTANHAYPSFLIRLSLSLRFIHKTPASINTMMDAHRDEV